MKDLKDMAPVTLLLVLVIAAMGVMVFWGLSGIFMWWQIKSVRWIGLATVALGAVIALGMGIAMHGAMIN